MKRKLFYALCLLFLTCCSDKLPFDSVDNATHDEETIKEKSFDISQRDAIKVAESFFKSETKNSSNKSINEVIVVRDSLQLPLMYVINYADNNGFIIISATKEFYPVLAYSEDGTYNLDSGMFSDAWLGVMKSEIIYRKSDSDTTYFSQWDKYSNPISATKNSSTTKSVESYQDISWWRSEFIADLWNTDNFPPGYFEAKGEFVGDMFCNLSEVREQLDDYSGDFDRVESYLTNLGYDPNVAIFHIKTFTTQAKKDIMLSTYWHQYPPYNRFCPGENPPGCVTVAIGQIMNYHKWPTYYMNWSNSDLNDNSAASLFAKIGSDIGMVYKSSGSYPKFWDPLIFGDLTHVKLFFRNNGYSVSKDSPQGNLREISQAILEGYPVYMEGSKESFSFWGITMPSFDAHAWVCDGFIMHKYNNVLVDVYLPQNYNPGNYTPLASNPFKRDYNFSISKEREYGWSYYHMNWGWGKGRYNVGGGSTSVNNGWFLNADISKSEDVNFSVLYRFIKVVPNR